MKKLNLMWIAAAAIMLVACNPDEPVNYTTVDFEDVTLVNGALDSVTYTTKGMTFLNNYDATYGSWSGFACSNQTDKETAGYLNDLSVYGTAGASGSQFAVLNYASYVGASVCSFADKTAHVVKSMQVTNGTYAYLSMSNGDNYAKKFAAGDWFKLTITGMNDSTETGAVDFYLADFREGKTFMCHNWTTVDLSSLGAVTALNFALSSTDTGEWGMNTPAYACIDDIMYETDAQ